MPTTSRGRSRRPAAWPTRRERRDSSRPPRGLGDWRELVRRWRLLIAAFVDRGLDVGHGEPPLPVHLAPRESPGAQLVDVPALPAPDQVGGLSGAVGEGVV